MEKYHLKDIEKNNELVKIVNRVFHNINSEKYENIHPEIYNKEKDWWSELFCRHIKPQGGVILLDMGTGSGFVIEAISKFLSANDLVIFCDISENMLGVVRKKFTEWPFRKKYLLTDAANIHLLDASVDAITVNSVLHHLPDWECFLKEADRLLKPSGIIAIRHEPNKLFANNFVLRNLFIIMRSLQTKNFFWSKNKDNIGVGKLLLESLKKEGIEFLSEVKAKDIQAIVDIESPTAYGGLSPQRGFNPYEIKEKFFPQYKTISIKTYNFFGAKIDEERTIWRRVLSKILKFFFPKQGYMFEFVIQKSLCR